MAKWLCPHCKAEGPFFSVETTSVIYSIEFTGDDEDPTKFEYTGERSVYFDEESYPSDPPTFQCKACDRDFEEPLRGDGPPEEK